MKHLDTHIAFSCPRCGSDQWGTHTMASSPRGFCQGNRDSEVWSRCSFEWDRAEDWKVMTIVSTTAFEGPDEFAMVEGAHRADPAGIGAQPPGDRMIELRMPKHCKVHVFRSTDPANDPGTWIIKAEVEALDVDTGKLGFFATTWRGGEPSLEDVAQTVVNMLAHEVAENLGLDPHRIAQVRRSES